MNKHDSELSNYNKYKILFVCLGNICRSPAAEGIMRQLIERRGLQDKIEVDSAGTYGGHAGSLPDRRMRVHARQRGYELTHLSRRIARDDFEYFDLIIAMDASNMSNLRQMAATLDEARKIVPMSRYFRQHTNYDYIPDPYYEGAEGFEIVLDLLEDACESLLDSIKLI